MKKETKRYFLVEYCGTKSLHYNTKEELDDMYDRIRKYNNRKTAKYICGNMTVTKVDNGYDVISHLYYKLTQRSTISELDDMTCQYSEKELVDLFSSVSKMKEGVYPDINIAYFEDKDRKENDEVIRRIKYIPVLYKEDLQFFDPEYIRKCLDYHARKLDYAFFKDLANEFCFHKAVSDEVEKLFSYCDKVQYRGYDPSILSIVAFSLFKELIYERDKDGSILRNEKGEYEISRRRFRDFSFFLKNYDSTKVKSPFRYNYKLPEYIEKKLIKKDTEFDN